MDSWTNEVMVEYHRQRILEEVEQIRLERLARKFRANRTRFFGRIMFNFGNWMISIGKQLRDRSRGPGDQSMFPTPN